MAGYANGTTNGVSAFDSIDISAQLAEHTRQREALFKEEEKLRHGKLALCTGLISKADV